MIRLTKIAGFSLALAVLSGCNNAELEIPDSHLISIEKMLLMDESTESEFEFKSFVDNPQLKINSIKPSGAAELTINENKVIIKAHELDRPGLIEASLFSSEGEFGDESTKNFEIIIKNTSAKYMESEIESALKSASNLTSLKEDREIFQFFVDIAYINKVINYTEKENTINGFNPLDSSYYQQMISDLLVLDSQFSKYKSAQISDDELLVYLEDVRSSLGNHSEYAVNKLLEIRNYYLPMIPDFTNGILAYSKKENKFSRYIGNTNLGYYSENKWFFYPTYKILEALVD